MLTDPVPVYGAPPTTSWGAPVSIGDIIWSGGGRIVYMGPIAPSVDTGGNTPATTGVNPTETQYSLYGHIIPLSVFGKGRIGGEIIAGPWVENGLASFIISFGVPADPTGTRILKEIAFDSEVIWQGTLTGAGTPSSSGFSTEPVTCRFYDGKLTQSADSLETSHFGGDAVAYRPQILLVFENLPLANTKFKKIPYVAAVISDASGEDVNLGEAFERLAYSPWVGYTSAQFETSGITDGLVGGGLIIAQDAEFLATIQSFVRFYPTWDILQTDKLRIVDRGDTVAPDITLNASRLKDAVTVTRRGQDSIKKDLELSTIDPDADYTIVPSVAQIPRDPVTITTSVGKDSQYLPVIMDSSTRAAVVTLARYHEEQTRKMISGTAMAYGMEIEPGDLVAIRGLGADFTNETFKIMETLHGANNTVEFTAAAFLKCVADTSDGDVTPNPVTNIVGMWDASVFSSLTISGGDHIISNVVDQSGNGNDLSLSTSGDPPTYSATGINGRPAMMFSGASGFHQQSLVNTSFPMGTGSTLTVWAVAYLGNSVLSTVGRLISYTAPAAAHDFNNAGSFALTRNSTNAQVIVQRNSVNTSAASVSYNTPRTIIATVKSDGTMTVYVDGVSSGTATSSGSWISNGFLSIGGSKFDSGIFGGYFDGAIGEVGLTSNYSDAATVAQLHASLKDKWSL